MIKISEKGFLLKSSDEYVQLFKFLVDWTKENDFLTDLKYKEY